MKKTYEFKIGDKVRFTNAGMHRACPYVCPPVGTVGKVYSIVYGAGLVSVQWPKGSTCYDDLWSAFTEDLELVEEAEE